MIACDRAINPPTPSPCNPRKQISWPMFWEKPAASEVTRKIPMADWNMIFRP
jgi:hypothetical protein